MKLRTLLLIGMTVSLSLGWRANVDTNIPVTFGKIYLTDNELIVGEVYRGINIHDITVPAGTHSIGYITLEGNLDVAVKGTILYADNYEDLLVFDYSNPAKPVLIDSVLNVFRGHTRPEPIYNSIQDYGGTSGCAATGCSQSNDVVVYETGENGRGGSLMTDGGKSGGGVGQAGSMARFVIVDDWLYCIDVSDLVVFSIRDPKKPKLEARVNIGFGIETLFAYEYYLFVGSQTGMFIYDARDIRVPIKVSEFRHARACDPVVVEGNRAYVTLRSGARCGPADNALHIIDISNVAEPKKIGEYQMEGPAGLSVVNGIAYICDGSRIRILDVKDENAIKEISTISIDDPYDVILRDDLLFITSPNGIFIYNIADPRNPTKVFFLSSIA